MMAASKKTTTKKTAVAKKPVAKNSVTKKAVPKKTTTKKTATTKASQNAPMRSFKRSTPETSFFTFKLTQQTLYWLILSVIVLILGVWVIRLETEIQGIYDSIEANSALIDEVAVPRTTES